MREVFVLVLILGIQVVADIVNVCRPEEQLSGRPHTMLVPGRHLSKY